MGSTPSTNRSLTPKEEKHPKIVSSIALNNYQAPENVIFDTLHGQAIQSEDTCPGAVCYGSVVLPKTKATQTKEDPVSVSEMEDFYKQYFNTQKISESEKEIRLSQVRASINQSKDYSMAREELQFACNTAWRNAPRCIGRIQWSKLKLIDGRLVRSTKGMFELICDHIEYANNRGNIRSAITVFPSKQSGFNCRIWNPEYISYAGFEVSPGVIVGDPNHVEITKICLQLGWKPTIDRFQVLPLVLQFGDKNPELYVLPDSLVMEVPITHPKYPKLGDLGLKWFAMPAVSGMSLECGGLVHPATGFNGWYMSTEIVRDLCDANRYNLLKEIAESMDMDISKPALFWKDLAATELNIAIITSFQAENIVITDHHTASETFMHHMENEQVSRGGCPADWVWITPPLGGSLTPVFHQEMLNYKLKPSYEYQTKPWIGFEWQGELRNNNSRKKRLTLKVVARAVMVCYKMMQAVLRERKQCTILFATETGQSERYAYKLQQQFDQDFNVEIFCMDKYDVSRLRNECLLLVVTSTFGNGEAPDNGKQFEKFLKNRAARRNSVLGPGVPVPQFAVFGLGSTAYPNYCAFSKTVDRLLKKIGFKQLLELHTGDEQKNQELAFRDWYTTVYSKTCQYFGISKSVVLSRLPSLVEDRSPSYILTPCAETLSPLQGLQKVHNKCVSACQTISVETLVTAGASNDTVLVKLMHKGLIYNPGDHLAVFPTNSQPNVKALCKSCIFEDDLDENSPVLLGASTSDIESEQTAEDRLLTRLPSTTLSTALTFYLDIEVTPKQSDIEHLLLVCQCSEEEGSKLGNMAGNSDDYNKWAESKPSWVDLVTEFPSLRIPASFLLAELLLLQPRYYSISSSPFLNADQVHLTVSVLEYTVGEAGSVRRKSGLCSTFLQKLSKDSQVLGFVKRCPGFHLPTYISQDVIMIGAGSGLAPFRGFWQHRECLTENIAAAVGEQYLFQGFRSHSVLLHRDEVNQAVTKGIIKAQHTAFSREETIAKTYVQDKLLEHTDLLYDLLVHKEAHVYVCGDIKMAVGVNEALRSILSAAKSEATAVYENQYLEEDYIEEMKQEGRYHEDIYSILI